jgi:hypothetical protein
MTSIKRTSKASYHLIKITTSSTNNSYSPGHKIYLYIDHKESDNKVKRSVNEICRP